MRRVEVVEEVEAGLVTPLACAGKERFPTSPLLRPSSTPQIRAAARHGALCPWGRDR